MAAHLPDMHTQPAHVYKWLSFVSVFVMSTNCVDSGRIVNRGNSDVSPSGLPHVILTGHPLINPQSACWQLAKSLFGRITSDNVECLEQVLVRHHLNRSYRAAQAGWETVGMFSEQAPTSDGTGVNPVPTLPEASAELERQNAAEVIVDVATASDGESANAGTHDFVPCCAAIFCDLAASLWSS